MFYLVPVSFTKRGVILFIMFFNWVSMLFKLTINSSIVFANLNLSGFFSVVNNETSFFKFVSVIVDVRSGIFIFFKFSIALLSSVYV